MGLPLGREGVMVVGEEVWLQQALLGGWDEAVLIGEPGQGSFPPLGGERGLIQEVGMRIGHFAETGKETRFRLAEDAVTLHHPVSDLLSPNETVIVIERGREGQGLVLGLLAGVILAMINYLLFMSL